MNKTEVLGAGFVPRDARVEFYYFLYHNLPFNLVIYPSRICIFRQEQTKKLDLRSSNS